MSDLIKREDAVKVCCEMVCGAACLPEEIQTCGIVRDCMNTIPAVDAVEVRHAYWRDGFEMQTCSACAYRGKRSYSYCPRCGARMDGEDGDT